MAPTSPTPNGSLALVRVAASKRKYLFGVRWWVAGYAVSILWQLVGPDWNVPFVITTLAILSYWALQRRYAVWIERDDSQIQVFARRGWHRDPKPRDSDAMPIKHYASTAAVLYGDSAKWWHASRSLQIDSDLYAIFPESRKLAAEIANARRWARGTDQR